VEHFESSHIVNTVILC